MTGIWKAKTRYFIKLSTEKMLEYLDVILVDIMGYDLEKEWQLKDVARCIKYLPNNEVAIDIQISNNALTEAQGVQSWIDAEDFQLAKYMFQVTRFLTEKEYISLTPIETTQ